MPYVEGFGTWPFGEEWLWEAIATSLRAIARRARPGADHAVADAGAVRPARGPRRRSSAACAFLARSAPSPTGATSSACASAAPTPRRRARALGGRVRGARPTALRARCDGGLLEALAPHATWTSSATHAVLPLLATRRRRSRCRCRPGSASHRRRFGELGRRLLAARVRARAVAGPDARGGRRARDLRRADRRRSGSATPRTCTRCATDEGPVLWPIDRADRCRSCGATGGYPSAGGLPRLPQPDRPRPPRVAQRRRPIRSRGRAGAGARCTPRDFVARVRGRVAAGGVCVCALDTELLGHWWYEGVHWLNAVVEEAARQGLTLTTLDDALERHEPVPPRRSFPAARSAGARGRPARRGAARPVADLAWQARTAELRRARRAAPSRASARCASCWRCSRATGRSWSPASSPATIRASAPRGHAEALARGARRRAAALEPRAARTSAPELAGWARLSPQAAQLPSGTSSARRACGSARRDRRRRPRWPGRRW